MIKKKPEWADRIRIARESKGITQRKLMDKLGINQATIVYYETGRREPRISYLLDIMNLSGVTGKWSETGPGSNPNTCFRLYCPGASILHPGISRQVKACGRNTKSM